MAFHKNAPLTDIHVPYAFSYADAATREAATGFVAEDVGKLALQEDLNTLWLLTATTPSWEPLAGATAITQAQKDALDNSDTPSDTNEYITKSAMTDFSLPYNTSMTTGVLEGGLLSVNVDNVTIDITAGKSLYVDMSDYDNPVVEELTWEAQNFDPILATNKRAWIGIQRTGPGTMQFVIDIDFTHLEKRTIAVLGRFWSLDDVTLAGVGQYTATSIYLPNTIYDIAAVLGSLNHFGNVFSAYDSVMTLDKTAGESFRMGANYDGSPLSPHIQTDAAMTNIQQYGYLLSSNLNTTAHTEIDPDNYDNAGVLTTVPVNQFTIQDIYYFPKSQVIDVVYGQQTYGSMSEAVANLNTEGKLLNDTMQDLLAGSILRCKLIIRQGTTDLSVGTDAKFVTIAGLGGGSTLSESITNHNDLLGVQGGTGATEQYHLTAEQHSELIPVDSLSPVLDKGPGVGIKVDVDTPSWGWRDLEGVELVDVVGANAATLALYNGVIREFAFGVNDILDIRFHMPHDYLPGSDMFVHVHWSHNGTSISGSFACDISHVYAKGHQQAAFTPPKTIAWSHNTVDIATTPQYQHNITELPLSVSGGSASEIDSADLEVDGLILMNLTVTGIPTITGSANNLPFIHRVDIHYQSTNIATLDKAPNFYTQPV